MKLYKNILISFLTALLTTFVVFGGYTIYAQDGEPANFRDPDLNFSEVFDAYHAEMNSYFNQKIERLNIILAQPNFLDNEDNKKAFNPPDIDSDPTACADNVSTYCVSMGALDKYIDYVNVLNNLVTTLATDTNTRTIENILTNTADRNERIKKEYDSAKQVMEATVAAYHEYRLAMPVHKRYEEIITELIKYKLALKDIRKRAMEFPIRFIDASSSQCE